MAELNAPGYLYEGTVRHRRQAPRAHSFEYGVFFLMVDLDRTDEALRRHPLWGTTPNVAWFARKDYHGPTDEPLAASIRRVVEDDGGQRPEKVLLLTHPRYFGVGFNPVSFYYCQDRHGALTTLVAEVSNTPWGERHLYVLHRSSARSRGRLHRWEFDKAFHVSPFMGMAQTYRWTFTEPGETLRVHMDNVEARHKVFDATMKLRQRPLDAFEMSRVLFAYPPMTLKVFGAIYWNALRLKLKKAPYYPHPKTTTTDDARLTGTS